ncbi:MAG: hypothetical protein HON70_45910 [Lentisphaerae bacterium]|nr:hypothetical protein [Lentisphaerota bacterium]
MQRRTRLVLVLVTTLTCLCVAESRAQSSSKSLLFLSGRVEQKPPGDPSKYRICSFLPDAKLQPKLKAWGYTWWADFFSTQLTLEWLKQFNAVVALDFPTIEKHRDVATEIRAVEAMLHEYVREGGGLLLTSAIESSQWGLERNTEELNRFLAPLGAQVNLEQVYEKNPILRLPKPNPRSSISRLAWTGNVSEHTLTEGVKGLIYPTDPGSMCYYTHPVRADDTWSILLRASDTACSITTPLGTKNSRKEQTPGTWEEAPPLLAARQVQKGRIALWPTIPSATIIDGYHEFWGRGLIMTESDTNHPSSGERLIRNLLEWLTAPSRNTFGGFKAPPRKEEKEAGLHRIPWDKIRLPKRQFAGTHKGLIGLKSNLSTGTDSPEAMIKAAQAAGYDFAAFSEDLEELTPEEIGALIALCAKYRSDTFQVFSGFVYRDASGNSWQVFGTDTHWPKDGWWQDKDAKTIAKNNVIFRGYQFFPVIMVHPNKNPEKPWFQGNFKGLAVYTYDNGKLVDDATDVYTRLQGDNYRLFPVVLHFVRSVEDVARAATPSLPQTYAPWPELSDILSAFSRTSPMHKGNHVFQWPQFVSSAPQVDLFRVVNFGTSDLAIPDNDRFRLQVRLRADVGLEEVRISDAGIPWRRLLPKGQKELAIELDGFHDRTHHFIITATDTQGGKLISSCIGTSVQELNVPRCTDNLNTYLAGKFEAVDVFPIRGLENYIFIQSGTFGYFPKLAGLKQLERPAIDQRLTHVSRFGYIRTDVFDHIYPPTATSNWNQNDIPEVASPDTPIRGRTRLTLFTPWANSTSIHHVEGRFEITRDLSVPRRTAAVFQNRWVEDAETFIISPKDGKMSVFCLKPRRRWRRGSLEDIEYIANIGPFGGARAIVPLSGGLDYAALQQGDPADPRSTLLASLSLGDDPDIPGGTEFHYEYLAICSEVRDHADISFVEDVFEGMGLRGKTAYDIRPTQGEVVDRRFVLRLKAVEHAFAATLTQAALPMRLPVFITGLNPKWPAGIWYKGKHQFLVPTWQMDKMHNRFASPKKVIHKDWLQRFGIVEGRGMLQLDTAFEDKQVFVGNLLVCDHPGVILELEDTRKGRVRIAANNPSDAPVTITVKPAAGFTLLGTFAKTITLPPGGFAKMGIED